MGYCFLPGVGESANGLHREPSFAVMNLAHTEYAVLGDEFAKEVPICGETKDREAYLVPIRYLCTCDLCHLRSPLTRAASRAFVSASLMRRIPARNHMPSKV